MNHAVNHALNHTLEFCHGTTPHSHLASLWHRFIAKVVGDTTADKPAKLLLFDDGAEVKFYMSVHPKARTAQKHVYLMNPEVMYKGLNKLNKDTEKAAKGKAVGKRPASAASKPAAKKVAQVTLAHNTPRTTP